MKFYKANARIYIPLLITASIIMVVSKAISTDNPWFAIVSGVGCGGFSSVLVAWLVDVANCRANNKNTQKMMEKMLLYADMRIATLMEVDILYLHAMHNDIDIDTSYSIDDMIVFIDSVQRIHTKLIHGWFKEITDCVLGFDVEKLFLCGNSEQNTKIYAAYNSCKMVCLHEKRWMGYCDDPEQKDDHIRNSMKNVLGAVKNMYESRGIILEIKLDEFQKANVLGYREMKARRKKKIETDT